MGNNPGYCKAVASGSDITQGLPRVEELFEARRPKGRAIVSEIGGKITVNESKRKREVIVQNDETGEAKTYTIPYGSSIKVHDGDIIEAGDELTVGSVNPNDILHIKGPHAVQVYIAREVQRTYRMHFPLNLYCVIRMFGVNGNSPQSLRKRKQV